MKTFIITSDGPYGLIVQIVNANNKQEVQDFANNHNYTWPGYCIEEINTKTKGLVFEEGS